MPAHDPFTPTINNLPPAMDTFDKFDWLSIKNAKNAKSGKCWCTLRNALSRIQTDA